MLVMTFIVFMFAGCKNEEQEYVDKGLNVGFANASSGYKIAQGDFCAYKSDVSVFYIDDVTLEFFYGGIFNDPPIWPEQLENLDITSNISLGFNNPALGEDRVIIVKEKNEWYLSDRYRWKGNAYESGEGETLTIPKELFISETGEIWFIVYAKDLSYLYGFPDGYIREGERHITSRIIISYTVNEDKVTLAEKEKTSRVPIIWVGISDM